MADNKKEAFTFSDKIKNSKPAFNPFARRVSSKIGANGKPKKTIFERTKRDAPFFIAALAALLLLPFLYKYSGSIEETGIITPGSADTVFDPYRDGIGGAFLDDPDGAIAQYTGRDPLSLIQGFGSPAPEDDFFGDIVDYRVQDGLDDNYTPARPSDSPRAYAPAATRAAFQRQATKINELGSAGLNLRGGAGVPFRFGGASLKRAAQADSAGAPKQGTKPVALQPLRAADSPSRSYFGQPGAAQARASREAMGKTNAAQAVRDAMFNPARTSAGVGGLGSGTFAPGGGAGQINHTLDFKGITPWWWDMMKERSQEAWRWKYFLWRKNFTEALVKSLGELAGLFAKNMGCCLLTGNQDCDMDTFLGASPENSTESTCCGLKKKDWVGDLEKYTFDKAGCDAFVKQGKLNKNFQCTDGWKEGRDIKKKQNFFQVRAACFGAVNLGSEYAQGDPGLKLVPGIGDCVALNRTRNYSVKPEGEAMKWHIYHYLVTRNYVPVTLDDGTKYVNLCDQQTPYEISKNRAAALAMIQNADSDSWDDAQKIDKEIEALEKQIKGYPADDPNRANLQTQLNEKYAELKLRFSEAVKKVRGDSRHFNNPVNEDFSDACVVYVSESNTLHWDTDVQTTMVKLLSKLIKQRGLATDDVQVAELATKAFKQMDWAFIESFASKYELAYKPDDLPMPYWQFFDYYLMRRGDNKVIADRKFRQEGIDSVPGERCYFDNAVKFYCEDTEGDDTAAKAVLSFTQAYQGGREPNAADVSVTAAFAPLDGSGATANEQNVRGTEQTDGSFVYSYTNPKWFSRELVQQNGAGEKAGVVTWRLYRGGEVIKTVSCDYHNEGGGITPEPNPPAGNPPPVVTENPPANRQYMKLAENMDKIPQDPAEHPVIGSDGVPTGSPSLVLYETSQFKKSDAGGDLDALTRAVLSSNSAKEFVNEVVKEYNKRQQSNPQAAILVGYDTERVPLAGFVDALHIAKTLSKTEVPRSAVCEMGRAIAVESRDETKSGSQQHGLTNTFGTFAIYVGLDSAYYPSENVTIGNAPPVKDMRFQDDEYWWGNYVKTKQGIYSITKQMIEAVKVNNEFPLASMVGSQISPIPVVDLRKDVSEYRKKYQETYGKILIAGDGECDSLTGNMPIQDALDYMGKVIELGLAYKPKSFRKTGQGGDGGTYNPTARRQDMTKSQTNN